MTQLSDITEDSHHVVIHFILSPGKVKCTLPPLLGQVENRPLITGGDGFSRMTSASLSLFSETAHTGNFHVLAPLQNQQSDGPICQFWLKGRESVPSEGSPLSPS